MDKSKSLSRLLNTVLKNKYSDISNIEVGYKLRRSLSFKDGEVDNHHYDIEVICNDDDYEWDANDVMNDIEELSKMILVDSNESIFSIFFRKKKKEINRINEMMGVPKEDKDQTISKLVEKFYNIDFKIESQTWSIIRLDMILTPKSDVVKEFGAIKYFSAWEIKSSLNKEFKFLDSNSAYADNTMFKNLGLQWDLNNWMLKKSREYINSI